jgi:hypothetical protein
MDMVTLEKRVNGLADALAQLVEVVSRLNAETYKESRGPEWIVRVNEDRPRVLGAKEAHDILEELRATLGSWRAEWAEIEGDAQAHSDTPP